MGGSTGKVLVSPYSEHMTELIQFASRNNMRCSGKKMNSSKELFHISIKQSYSYLKSQWAVI